MQFDELGEVVVVERIGFAEVAAGIELVIPDFARGCAFFEKEDDGLNACALKRAAGAIEYGVEIAAFEEQLAKADGGIVGVREKGVFDNDATAPTGFEDFDEMLQEEEGGFAGLDVEVLLNFLALAAAEGRIGEDDLVAVFVLDVVDVFGEGVGVEDVGRFDAVEDHVHDGDDVG